MSLCYVTTISHSILTMRSGSTRVCDKCQAYQLMGSSCGPHPVQVNGCYCLVLLRPVKDVHTCIIMMDSIAIRKGSYTHGTLTDTVVVICLQSVTNAGP